jgi:hypothetical protein
VEQLIHIQSDGKQPFHGVLARPVVGSPLPTALTTSTFTLAATAYPITYYYNGKPVLVNTNQTCTLGVAGLYFIVFNAALGTLLAVTTRPAIAFTDNVTIATVLWNGTDYGLVSDERHSYDDNLPWHAWAHKNIGCVYNSGLALTASGSGATSTLSLAAGEVDDEDIQFVIGPQTTCRQFWATAAGVLAFDKVARSTPMKLGANNRPCYVNGSTYALTEMSNAGNRYVNVFFFATTDLGLPLSMVVETLDAATAANNGYTTTDLARAAPWPNMSNYGVGREIKAIYRVVVRADGTVQSPLIGDDVRLNSPIPVGGSSGGVTASTVSFNPTGGISSTTVQTALAELDTEKANALFTMQYDYVIDSNAKFLAWQGMTSGCEKVLIRKGTWTLASGEINLSTTGTKVVVGEPGSGLVFSSGERGLRYSLPPTSNDYFMRNVNIICNGPTTVGYAVPFDCCTNLTNCNGTGTSIIANGYGFNACTNLTNCTGTGTSSAGGAKGYGFSSCTNLTNCTGTGTGTGTGSGAGGFGFYGCTNLTNCKGTGNSSAGAGGYGFYDCTNLTNCTGTGTGSGAGGFGFYGCTNLTNCNGTGTSSAGGFGFYGCTNLTNCNGTGTSSAGGDIGFGFYGCTNLTNCTGTGTGSGAGGYGFSSCTKLTNCKGTGNSSAGGDIGFGFSDCRKVQQCSSLSNGYSQSYASSGTANPCADTAAGGYNS